MTPRRHRWKRRALRILACAAAGAVLTVLAGWACVFAALDSFPAWIVMDSTPWSDVDAPDGFFDRGSEHVTRALGVTDRSWGPLDPATDPRRAHMYAFGFPGRSMTFAARTWRERGVRIRWSDGVMVPSMFRRFARVPVPLRPELPGFALDTAFYGGLAFVLWTAPGLVRRRVRRRRGQCPACGYDLRGLAVCPECGETPRA